MLSDDEERQTHAAPLSGNGGRVPRSDSAYGSALSVGTSVRLRERTRDEDGEWLEAGELGMLIGFQGELVIVSLSEGRTATTGPGNLTAQAPRTGR